MNNLWEKHTLKIFNNWRVKFSWPSQLVSAKLASSVTLIHNFNKIRNGLNDCKGPESIYYTRMTYVESFSSRKHAFIILTP